MESVVQIEEIVNCADESNFDFNSFFSDDKFTNNEVDVKKEEKDYQELCLTSLTVCCTCD